ncbi:hypothetical protein [Methylocystis sp. Sn-Cys]|uniref:hypothetical protein n=1 Tax=Methylocystis sp. Sn-Cys TaxID=1701263 RepID=UPI0019223DE5|nr:hypothetical protein [Methylocystis sp. Sn-Cys]MBL1257495.1 hypothetical protein [Methylocystis sp. Sn-Cys]
MALTPAFSFGEQTGIGISVKKLSSDGRFDVENQNTLRNYLVHPKHKDFASKLSKIVDWIVGDIAAGLPTADS